MLSSLLAIIKAIPALKSIFEGLFSLYVQKEIENMKKENRDAIKKAINEHDQRLIERALGNPRAGEASGDAGAVIIDHAPGRLPK